MSTFPVIRNDRDFLAAIVAGVPCHTVQDPDTLALSWQTDPCAVVRDECGNVSQVVRLMNAHADGRDASPRTVRRDVGTPDRKDGDE